MKVSFPRRRAHAPSSSLYSLRRTKKGPQTHPVSTNLLSVTALPTIINLHPSKKALNSFTAPSLWASFSPTSPPKSPITPSFHTISIHRLAAFACMGLEPSPHPIKTADFNPAAKATTSNRRDCEKISPERDCVSRGG